MHKYIDKCSCIICVFMWLLTTKLVTILNTEVELSMGAVWVEVELNKSI